ncbi:hypothetical protein QJS04_geneDACA013183 [Acorus gramineus]|uniref:Uncharacterized protein n=1 Tax=Acorus gramineus TaxID=55184 RepID=A0AAV9B8U6_ACOGR|nr:hypothetical protein QJS04_geneDACA013183 [Acorus gramineus]
MAPSGKRGRGRSRALQARGGLTSIPSRCTSAPSRTITPQGSSVQESTPPHIQPTQVEGESSPRLSSTDTHASASTVPSTNPTPPPRKKTRGPSMGLNSNKLVRELRGPIQLTFNLTIGRPNNPEHNKMFTTECGVICRNHAPLRLSRWGDISSTGYAELVRHLQGKFQWDETDTVAIEFINKQLGQVWRQQRCKHAKRIQELIAKGSDPQAHPAMGVSQADWEWIVDFIRSDTYQVVSSLDNMVCFSLKKICMFNTLYFILCRQVED